MPIGEVRFLDLAQEDGWAADSMAEFLGRPAAWIDFARAAALYQKLIVQAIAHNPVSVPKWLHRAVQGAAAAAGPTAATQAAASLLALTINSSAPDFASVADLVAVTRAALRQTDDPEQAASADPLPPCSQLIRDAYARAIPHDLATGYVISMFTTLSEEDRSEVLRALLS
ncbi:hypothetical protein [Frankia sp. QA3]|uniref:hypothetical protein n=1 Tax=Frankia sp. QA3 TaxID=710111 RepID=UPI000269CA7A|nr:hypothetical protein [Frankia sp. QA3]EIV94911.1 hypothetical protein FraQA3DRAFT_4704 [Frankia sp. QA3]